MKSMWDNGVLSFKAIVCLLVLISAASHVFGATVSSVTSSTANGTYTAGDAIDIQVTFSESVDITGTPQLTLETGSSDAVVDYASGGRGISTVAGDGNEGYSGDGGAATSARFDSESECFRLAVDSVGNIYVAVEVFR